MYVTNEEYSPRQVRAGRGIQLLVVLFCFLSFSLINARAAEEGRTPAIPENTILTLQKELTGLNGKKLSLTRRRRACKNLIRKGNHLIKAHPQAPNRFQVMHMMLNAQKRLITLEKSQRNRDSFFAICKKLLEAPDEFAGLRLEAELVLSDRELRSKEADVDAHIKALFRIIKNYRDTPAERKSLMLASKRASDLGKLKKKEEIIGILKERFAGDPKAIAFRKKQAKSRSLAVLFAGTFERVDGVTLSLPIDRMGRPFVALFWSKKNPEFKTYLEQVKAQQNLHPGAYEIFSFNLDELPDAGQSILRDIGLACTVMRLPCGKNSDAFITYGQHDPYALIINHYGRATLPPIDTFKAMARAKEAPAHGGGHEGGKKDWSFKYPQVTESHSRISMQLQSLLIGDFLVRDASALPKGKRSSQSVPLDILKQIQGGFTAPPFRYRETPTQALATYRKVEELCRRTLEKYPQDSELWRVRNFRIVALLGQWISSGEPSYLAQAVNESKTVITSKLPKEAQVIAQFCLAKHSLRKGEKPDAVLSKFIESTGGKDAPGEALATAIILAMDAAGKVLHEHYRELFLSAHGDKPALLTVSSFLRNRYYRLHMFKDRPLPNSEGYYMKWTMIRYLTNNDTVSTHKPFPAVRLNTLDGKTLSLPEKQSKELTLLVFVEPPADRSTVLSPQICLPPKKASPTGKAVPGPTGFMPNVMKLAGRHVNKELDVVFAFLSDDVAHIKALKQKYQWPWPVALVPGGLANPLVHQLGILSADRVPNAFLIRRDGTLAWSARGLVYPGLVGHQSMRMEWSILIWVTRLDIEAGYRELKKGNLPKALKHFSGPFPFAAQDPDAYRRPHQKPIHKWHSSRLHGRSLTHLKLNKLEDALADIDTAISEHSIDFRHGKDQPCSSMVHMLRTRSKILDRLGRKAEARQARQKASVVKAYPTDYFRILGYNRPYELFQDKLSELTGE